jgi:hypothetical protein
MSPRDVGLGIGQDKVDMGSSEKEVVIGSLR